MNYYNSETLLEQQAEIEKLKAERDALAATVEALRATLDECAEEFELNGEHDNRVYTLVKVALAATPQQHLAEIRAEAVLDFANHVFTGNDYLHMNLNAYANQYAEQIRQEK